MIDFSPPPHVQATVEAIERFITDELEPIQRDLARHLSNEHLYLREDGRLAPEVLEAQRTIRRRSAERGFYALHMPKEVGGGGFCLTDMFFVHEAVYRHGIGVTQWLLSWTEGPNQMMQFLSAEQKQKYLRPMIRGEWTAAYAITEYRGGSDVLSMETRAARRGDEWVIDGTKAYITNAPYADLIMVCAMTAPERRSAGATLFIVERDTPGLRIGRTYRTIMDDGMTGELLFENCRVPLANTWGAEGEGFYISMGMINWIRVRRGGMCSGLGQYLLDRCVSYVKNRQAFGGPLSRFQGLQWMIVDSYLDVQAMRSLSLHCLWQADQGNLWTLKVDPSLIQAVCALKVFCDEALYRVADRAVQVHGAYGLTKESGIEKIFRIARNLRIPGGTDEIQRVNIAKMLGL
ncbi:MAG: acyl-CoA dehydrogenase [Candidatus Binatia bacterium]|nr:acyl-CoA dehydrogenase [Candidatus Binatia bacterium]